MNPRSLLACCLIPLLIPCALAAAEEPDAAPRAEAVSTKKAVASTRLLLPFFLVDTTQANGADTFFSVRNETTQQEKIRVSYYASDRPSNPLFVDPVTLPGKRLRQFRVSLAPNLLADDDGFARGFVIIEATSENAVIQGDYYQLTPNQGFASGFRLLNVEPTGSNDLCSLLTIRFLSGGAFDDTDLTFWIDSAQQPDGETPVASYAIYNEAGVLRFASDLYATEVAFRRTAAELTSIVPTSFGVLEIQFADGLNGHVTATLSALGLYSVGVEAVCRN